MYLRLRPALVLSICIVLCAPFRALGTTSLERAIQNAEEHHAHGDPNQRLKEVEKSRKEIQARIREARQKEHEAYQQLHHIKATLDQTQGALDQSKHRLKKTETRIHDTETKICQTKSQEELMSDAAGSRLREIYEGERLGLIEMIFQVSSLQTLLDIFYYQERIADTDRALLDGLRVKAAALAAKKNQLGSQKNMLGDLVSQFAQKALKLNKEKDDQEAFAEKLRTQRAFYEQAEQQLAQESQQLEHQIVDMCHTSKDRKNLVQGSGTMSFPIHAPITSPFGWRRHPIFGVRKFHTGVDLAGANHTAIHAADSGNVLYSGWYGGYGKVVIVSHGKGMATLYAHMSKLNVSAGENVHKGDVVGYEGTTGFSTGPHLHFEVRVDGKPNNPLNFVR